MKRTNRQNLCSVSDMSETDWAAWSDLRTGNPALQSPYFHPDYVRLLAELRGDVRIAVERDPGGSPRAFLPVQGARFARPVGAPMSDYHALISAPDSGATYESVLQETGAGAFHYSHAVDPDRLRAPQILSREMTCTLEIETTAEDWRAARDGSYRRHLKSTRRRIRKAEDEIGPRRVELFCRNIDVYAALIQWKREKFAQTGKYDVLSADWTQSLIRKLWERGRSADLRCDMHALYFGDTLSAIDLGLSDGTTFHSWMVAYNDDLQSYAPGIQLMEALIDATPETGYRRIDLGAGLDGYKRHYATHGTEVVGGLVPIAGAAGRLSRLYAKTEVWGEQALGDVPGKLRRRYSQIAACEDHFLGRARHMMAAVAGARKASN